MDPSGIVLWLGERFIRIGESLLGRSQRRRSFDAEVLETSVRQLNAMTDAALAVLVGRRNDPELLRRIEQADAELWSDPNLIPDQEAVTRLLKATSEVIFHAVGDPPGPIDIAELSGRINAARSEVVQSALKRRRELA
jgi:hypothetical protein